MNTKILIVGSHYNIDKAKYASNIVAINDNMTISQYITNNKELVEQNGNYKFISTDDIEISLKNNSFMFLLTKDNALKGITLDMLYNNDIFILNIDEFNNIPENILGHNDILVIWLDTKYHNHDESLHKDILETKFLLERLEYVNYMYFLDEPTEVVTKAVLNYCEAKTQEEREEILQEYL